MKPGQKNTKSSKSTAETSKKSKGFTGEEHSAMRERVKEMRAGEENDEIAISSQR